MPTKPSRKPGPTPPTSLRLTDADKAEIAAVGRLLLPSNPPGVAAVVRQSVRIARRVLEAQPRVQPPRAYRRSANQGEV